MSRERKYLCTHCGQEVVFVSLQAAHDKSDHKCDRRVRMQQEQPPRQRRASKFNAQRTEVDGITFDSKGEAGRWQELQMMQRAGVIQGLVRQVVMEIHIDGKTCEYRADFAYWENSRLVIEDFKGVKTPVYRLKKKLVYQALGLEITESGHSKGA